MAEGNYSELEAVAYIRSSRAVRERSRQLYDLARSSQLHHFRLEEDNLQRAVDLTIKEIRQNYPDLRVPFHSRWRHFEGPQSSRLRLFAEAHGAATSEERGIAAFDLAIVSVLLDAGAGAQWRYRDAQGLVYSRSEGLAMASFDACARGDFSRDGKTPFEVDAERISTFQEQTLAQILQVNEANPILGLEGRCSLLRALGRECLKKGHYFGESRQRPGNLYVHFLGLAKDNSLPAQQILSSLLGAFSDIWPGRISIAGHNLGDTWKHSLVQGDRNTQGLVPFHKLSQWLTYSLIEPLQQGGLRILEVEKLTGLAEYRNGGLFVDTGVLIPLHIQESKVPHSVNSEFVIEWRALTLVLLDELAARVRSILKQNSEQLPLPAILQGGTWSAGRKCAAARRPDATPPFIIQSDGTVF